MGAAGTRAPALSKVGGGAQVGYCPSQFFVTELRHWELSDKNWIEQATPCFSECRSNHLAIGTVENILLKLFHYLFYIIINQYVWQACIKNDVDYMCIGTNSVAEGGSGDTCPCTFKSGGGTSGLLPLPFFRHWGTPLGTVRQNLHFFYQ